MTTPEEFEALGVYDPADADAAPRLRLLDWLVELGLSIDEIVAAAAEENLGGVASDMRVLPGERLSDADAAAMADLPIDQLREYAMAFGFTPSAAAAQLGLTAPEATIFATFAALSSMFSDDEALGFVRVVGSSMARIADAAVSLFLADVEAGFIGQVGHEFELAKKSFDAVGLLDGFAPMLDLVLRRHIAQATFRSRVALLNEDRRQMRYAIGFVDLVGFTPISRNLSAEELAAFIRDFEGRAHDAVTANGARLVKVIGDEVMFVAPEPDAVCRVARELMRGFGSSSGHVVPRGGLAFGEVLIQGGDYYGEIVNLASRLTDIAVPHEVLVSETFADAAGSFEFEAAGRRQLKGFADPIAVRSIDFR